MDRSNPPHPVQVAASPHEYGAHFVVSNDEIELSLQSRGAAITSLRHRGQQLVLGVLDGVEDTESLTYAGVVVGRYANRIAGGRFRLDGVGVVIPANDGPNALHGGARGFHTLDWTGRRLTDGVEFTLISPDGEMGFPGELTARVSYRLRGASLVIEMTATTTAATVVNLTQHSYFTLAGDVRDQQLWLRADRVLETDPTGIPLPGVADLAGHDLDFRTPRPIGSARGGSIDHCFWLTEETTTPGAILTDPASGRRLTIHTDAPGIQVYAGEHLPTPFAGVALETQWLPDSPNRPDFPSTVLRPGQTWQTTTTWTFD